MTRQSLSKEGLPLAVRRKIDAVGKNIKLARKRRGLTMQDMADRMFVTRKTLNRLESGDPGVGFAIVAAALLALGLEQDLDHLANPATDRTGNFLDQKKHDQIQRIRPARGVDLDF